MQILKIWDYEYPWDVRVEKISKALTSAGHSVHLVARNRRRERLTESLDECTVYRMRPWRWAGSTLDAASQFPAFFNPRWVTHIRRIGKRTGAEVILVRDLPLAPAAIYVSRRLKIPVILDMAENYAAMMRDLWDTGSTRFGDSVVRNPAAVEAVERWVLRRVDHTLVVVEESKERLLALGVQSDKVSIVGNTPALSRLADFSRIRTSSVADSPSSNGTFRLVYLGLMEEARGVRQVIQAVAVARSQGLPVTLDLIGSGRSLGALRELAGSENLSGKAIQFHGFKPYKEALSMVAGMDAGLIPHYANESWETTIPNKLFDYMSLGLPVIASDVSPVKRILGETGAGATFRDRDVGDLARVIVGLYKDPARGEMGKRGIEAIRRRYHFERDAEVLKTAIERVASG